MHKNLLFILLIAAAGIGTAFLFRQPEGRASAGAIPSIVNKPSIEAPATQTTQYPTQDKDGIEVSVTGIEQRAETTVLKLALSNHRYDLAQETIYTEATLNGELAQSYAILSNAAGGHHVEAEIVFAKTTDGSLKITPAGQTTFMFDDLW